MLYDDALELHDECRRLAEEVLGKENPDTIKYRESRDKLMKADIEHADKVRIMT